MKNAIQDPPIEYDFGLDFDYAVWIPGTTLDLVNVPWNNDYRDVVKFGSRTLLDSYIDSLKPAGTHVSQLSYVKPNEPVRINIPFNRAIKYNYLRASNPLQPIYPPDEKRNFYYFILDVRYVAPNTTELVLQLDVWSTYIFDVKIGRCYVERGHIGIANENSWNNLGRDYLTVPEGLDFGSEYRHVVHKRINMYGYASGHIDTEATVLVVSTVDLRANPGDVTAPILVSATGQQAFGLPTGANMYVFPETADFEKFMSVYSTKPWVTQGIISITLIPPIKRYFPNFVFTAQIPDLEGSKGTLAPVDPGRVIQDDVFPHWREADVFKQNIGDRYWHLKKFLTYPYMVIELTTYSGNVTLLKPESWHNADARLTEIPCLFPPNQRIIWVPTDYNASASNPDNEIITETSDSLNVFVTLTNFPTIPIVNNGAIQYMAANKNQIYWGRQSADWSQQRALQTNQAGYDIATGAINTARDTTAIANVGASGQTAIGNMGALQGAMVDMIADPLMGAASGPQGLVGGGVAGISGGVKSLINTNINDMSTALANNSRSAATAIGNRQTGLVRDTNKGLADWAAKGDYANTIAGINAKVQDAQLTPPSVAGQFGGEALNYTHQMSGVSVKWKLIDLANIRIIGEYWLRYGYAVRASIKMPDSLMVMNNFTYWKLNETYISSATAPEGFKQVIRGIFEKGVTIWSHPVNIGTLDWAENYPLPGVKY